jgi:hypothetical protein
MVTITRVDLRQFNPCLCAAGERCSQGGGPARLCGLESADAGLQGASPALGDALNAGFSYLEVRCLGCDTHQTVALNVIRRPKTTPIHELERYMRCKDCRRFEAIRTSAAISSLSGRTRFQPTLPRRPGGLASDDPNRRTPKAGGDCRGRRCDGGQLGSRPGTGRPEFPVAKSSLFIRKPWTRASPKHTARASTIKSCSLTWRVGSGIWLDSRASVNAIAPAYSQRKRLP